MLSSILYVLQMKIMAIGTIANAKRLFRDYAFITYWMADDF